MVEKICRHCGSAVLVGLQYCPGCLRSVTTDGALIAPGANGNPFERIQNRWEECVAWFSPGNPALASSKSSAGGATSMSEPYTRVICPKCLRPHKVPFNQPPTSRLMCTSCLHQFPASSAAEFRKGADLNCMNCGVTTFCVNGLKVNQCPNCRTPVVRRRDPEKAKLVVLVGAASSLILVGFAHSVATQTTPQFLVWLCIGSVFTVLGFLTMMALGL